LSSGRLPPGRRRRDDLVNIRLATTEARLVVLARSGDLPDQVRVAAEAYLRRDA
jgi:hypothetical protein